MEYSELKTQSPMLAFLWRYHKNENVPGISHRHLWHELAQRGGTIALLPSRAYCRLMARVPSENCSLRSFIHLDTAWRQPHLRKPLQHVCRWNRDALNLLQSWLLPYVNGALLNEAVQTPGEELWVSVALSQLVNAWETLHRPDDFWPYANLSNPSQLRRAACRLQECEFLGDGEVLPVQDLRPPAGTILIDTVGQLKKEAREMRNCILEYAASIRAGNHLVYRMERPQRATVLLARNGDSWNFAQAVGEGNSFLWPVTQSVLRQWAIRIGASYQVADHPMADNDDLPF